MLSYKGLDEVTRHTQLTFDPAPSELTVTCASYAFDLAPNEAKRIFLTAAWAEPDAARPVPFMRGLLAAHRELRAATSGMTTIETSNDLFNEVLCRSAADLAMLMTDTPQGRYPYAGIPWYSTTFGRDGLITALQMLWCDPRIARGVLSRLAVRSRRAALTRCPMPSPARSCMKCAMAKWPRSAKCRSGLYYGSVNSTPLFVLLAGLYVERTGDDDLLARTLAIDRSGAALDRWRWRSGSGRLRRIPPQDREGPREPGLEGFVRCSLSCQWPDLPKARSRSRRFRAMSLPPSRWRRVARDV